MPKTPSYRRTTRPRPPPEPTTPPSTTKRRKTSSDEQAEPVPAFPTHRAYDPLTSKLQTSAQLLTSTIMQVLAQQRTVSKGFENAFQVACKSAQDPPFIKPVIGLFGKTGQGKSELVNAITQQSDASKSAGSGDALTSVAMLFISPLQDQQKKHCAIVHIIHQDRLRTTVTQWVQDYTRFHFEPHSELSEEEIAECEKLANLANNRFRTLFNNKAAFTTDARALEFFRTRHNDSAAVVHQLLACSSALNDELEPYIYHRDGLTTSLLWPLVDLVEKVCPDSPHLRYFHILDLPYMSETDESRANIAHEHFLRCQALWAVGSISRASADKKLDDILAMYEQRFGKDVALVLTCSDANVDSNTAKELESQGANMQEYWRESAQVCNIVKQIADTNAHLTNTQPTEDCGKLAQKFWQLQSESLPQAKTAQLDAFVKARNNHIVAKARVAKQHQLPPTVELRVFCVSSTHFNAQVAGVDPGDTIMSTDCTNIPSLRLHALSLAGDAKFSSCYTSIDSTVSLFEGLALWNAASPKRPRGLETILDAPIKHLRSISETLQHDVHELLDIKLLGAVADGQTTFRKQAQDALQDTWTQYLETTFRAFVFRNGKHATASQKRAIWNEKFAEGQNVAICERWPSLLEGLRKLFQKHVDELLECVQVMFQKLTANADPERVKILRGLLLSYIECIRRAYAKLATGNTGLGRRLDIIKEKATKDVDTSYFKNCAAKDIRCLQEGARIRMR
ncbi:hypothetical protein BST61_g1782 [Cercospora zeina]